MDIVRPRSVGMQAAEVGDCSYERRVSSSTRKTTNTTDSMLQAQPRWPVVTLQYYSGHLALITMQLHAPCARPDPISPPASRSLARHGHGPATPVLRRLDSPDSILDRLEQRPTLSTKAIRDFRRKWSADGVHWGGVRKLLSLSEPDERGVACTLPTPGPRPRKPPEQDGRRGSKAERAASVLCAAARGRAVRRELALVHATATYLQARGLASPD
jgi:hypothetical protein